MKKIALILSAIALISGIAPAQAAETRTVTGASAYYRADLGYMVGWTLPSDTKGIKSYTVTASPTGLTCKASGATNNKCVFTTKQLPSGNTYNFSVVVNSVNGDSVSSAPSNQIKSASIPFAPQQPLANVNSDTEISVAWVPNTNDGGSPLYGYRVNVWESLPNGDPGAVAFDGLSTTTTIKVSGLKPGTLYVVNVQSCNSYGCNSADKWTYVSTTGSSDISAVVPPKSASGGNPSTSCWNRTVDAGNAASTGIAFTNTGYTCPAVFVDPSQYPVIIAGANTPINLATKFAQSATFSGFSKTYSMSAWSITGGVKWTSYLFSASKAPVGGFTITPTVTSLTPSVCQVQGTLVRFASTGTCTVSGSIGENGIWKSASVATTSFQIIP